MSVLDASIVIPEYNESARLLEGFARLETAAEEGRFDFDHFEVIYVDDGSSDDTAAVAQRIVDRLPHGSVLVQPENLGKGAAVRAGVRAATGRSVVFTDADLAIDPRQLPTLLAALEQDPVAVGTRAIGGHIDYGTWLRTRAGRTFNLLVRSLSRINLRDTQCGFKAARVAAAKVRFHDTTINGFAFDVEFLSRARGLEGSVAEVPVSWRDVPGSHVDIARHSLTMLTDLARARMASGSLPSLLGLDLPAEVAFDDVAAACAGTTLEAAPILTDRSGASTLLATLHAPADASPALQRLLTALGDGWVRPVKGHEIRDALTLRAALSTE